MKILTLYRLPQNEFYTPGILVPEDKVPICVTLERLWKNNERGVSCIYGDREYALKRTIYHRHGYDTYEVICPPRERVLFHTGNINDDTHGCVILGEQFDPVLNKKTGIIEPGVLSSGPAFKQFMKYMGEDVEAKLVIKEVR